MEELFRGCLDDINRLMDEGRGVLMGWSYEAAKAKSARCWHATRSTSRQRKRWPRPTSVSGTATKPTSIGGARGASPPTLAEGRTRHRL